MIKLNKNQPDALSFKIIKFLFHSTLLNMFRTPLCPSSGASHYCTCSLWSPCGVVSVGSSSTVRLLLLLSHMQPLVTVWCSFGCILQPCSIVTVTTEKGWRTQPKLNHTVTRDCKCSGGKHLMMDPVESETC
jgi:hypothetical protein